MNKFYFRLLAFFFAYILVLNTCSFMAGLDPKQLVNPFYLKNRTEASFYLLKNIILYTGVNIKLVTEDEIEDMAAKAAQTYGIGEYVLNTLIERENEYSISLAGGMGLTSISPELFAESGLGDPFSPEQNINAAALAIKKFIVGGIPENELESRFRAGKVYVREI